MPTYDGPAAVGAAVEAGDRVWTDARPDTASTSAAQPSRDAAAPLDAALGYARRRWPVFPCHWQGERRKRPLVADWPHVASLDEAQIRDWGRRWPDALIGAPTGKAMAAVVLDVDTKRTEANGFDTLADLGHSILPDTPMVHTESGGLHIYFQRPDHLEIRNTAGAEGRGIGPGLDWRGEGGYVIVPSTGSGYYWDPYWNLDTAPLAPVPDALLPRVPTRPTTAARPVRPATGLSLYAEAALDGACRRILAAPDGEQEQTLNSEAFSIGTLAGAGAIPADFARRVLIWAARQIPDHDHRHPWQDREIEAKVNRAFDEGMRRPRKLHRA